MSFDERLHQIALDWMNDIGNPVKKRKMVQELKNIMLKRKSE